MSHDRPTFGSLFAGIGGIDLGLERAGWECRFQVEWDAYCQAVLAKHWPDVPRYGDITTVDWSSVERVDLLAGGFPCQPFSVAGKQRAQADDRWLWPEFERAIRALRPRHVLVENVPGLLGSHGGLGNVLGDLAALGYDAEWDCVPAAAVGAPHLRYRVWIVAHPHKDQLWVQPAGLAGSDGPPVLGDDGADGPMADAHGAGLEGRQLQPERPDQWPAGPGGMDDPDRERCEAGGAERDRDDAPLRGRGERARHVQAAPVASGSSDVGHADRASSDAYPASSGPRGAASQSGWWRTEPDVGRVAHGVPARVDRLRALGNAVVPQVVEVIGRQLLQAMNR